jgi:preprotein translocase subunit Sec61beta
MATIQGPRSQAGIISFYDAPEKGHLFNPKTLLIAIFAFSVAIIILDHFIAIS